ncbi:hypothetical protein, partial [Paraburkholderia sp. SIMBA_027]|uniref:hypothetical protein n=1 Tax=Paraburkholderia sp. SIMBA_027 TaxID=3085770 RepID=UPI00397CC5E2
QATQKYCGCACFNLNPIASTIPGSVHVDINNFAKLHTICFKNFHQSSLTYLRCGTTTEVIKRVVR